MSCGACDAKGTAGSEVLDLERTASEVVVKLHGKRVIVYQFTGGWKPYLKEYRNASGINVIRDSPPDHRHHHGVMFAVGVDGVNFWEEEEQSGRQEHRRLLPVVEGATAGVSYVSFGQELAWTRAGDPMPLLEETRRLAVCFVEELGATLMDWRSLLIVPQGREGVVLSGPKYVGLGVRFVGPMDRGGQFRNANGEAGARGTDGAEAAWTAYSGPVGHGRVATVSVFGDLSRPPRWFTLGEPFAYLGATLGLDRKPLRLPEKGRLELRYGLAVWDTTPEPARIQTLYERWRALAQGLPQ
jgi:LacI family transcriptional regulator